MATTEPTVNGSTPAPEPVPQPDPTTTTTTEPDPPTPNRTELDSAPEAEPIVSPTTTTATAAAADKKWPGWPGHCVFRLIVPVLKVGSIIGRKGDLIKKMCEDTRARIRVLDGAVGTHDRVVLISGKEEPEAPVSPAMDAVIRIFKRVSGLAEGEGDTQPSGAAGVAFCSIRLLVASTQAINLIGKQGSLIKSIQESTTASVRVLSADEVPAYVAADERIVELQGEALKVLKALEAVVGHLRKFLVDHSVLFLFDKNIAQTMQIPFSYAEDIIGIGGANIAYVRRSSGAIISIQESRGLSDELTVEIKGTSSQVQMAQQLIQEFMNNHKEPLTSSYGRYDTGLRSSYSPLGSTSYPSLSLSSQPYGGYGSSGVGGYSSFRL